MTHATLPANKIMHACNRKLTELEQTHCPSDFLQHIVALRDMARAAYYEDSANNKGLITVSHSDFVFIHMYYPFNKNTQFGE